MPKSRTSWSVSARKRREKRREGHHTEGLKTKYGKCQAAGTESATLHSLSGLLNTGSRHGSMPTRKVFLFSFSFYDDRRTRGGPMADIPLIKFCTSSSVNMAVMMASQTITK